MPAAAVLALLLVQAPQPVEVRYVANAGVSITCQGQRLLIDALHAPYQPAYLAPDRDTLIAIETGADPFNGAVAALVTHYHKDHFDGHAAGRFLAANPTARLIGPQQAALRVAEEYQGEAKVRPRIDGWPPAKGKTRSFTFGPFRIEAIPVSHVNVQHVRVQHLIYLVEAGGKRVLHTGDAELNAQTLSAVDLKARTIDLAILPYWVLFNQAAYARADNLIGAKRYVGMHIDPREAAGVLERLKPQGAEGLTVPGQTIVLD